MTICILKRLILLTCPLVATWAAIAGSSATAITTISANIVPAASFSASRPLLLNELPADFASAENHKLRALTRGRRVLLGTAKPAEFFLKNDQNLVHDISVPSFSRASDQTGRKSVSIEHISSEKSYNIDSGHYTIDIDEAVLNNKNSKAGTYRGLIDITVNYN